MAEPIDVKGMDKAGLLFGLVNAAKPAARFGMRARLSHYDLTDAIAAVAAATRAAPPFARPRLVFDEVAGRRLAIDLTGDTLDPTGYDRANGPGAAAGAVSEIRAAEVSARFMADQAIEAQATVDARKADPDAWWEPRLTEDEQHDVDFLYRMAKEALEEKGQIRLPQWIMKMADDSRTVIALDIGSPDDVEVYGAKLRETALRGHAVFAAGYVETWTISTDGDEPDEATQAALREKRLNELPGRQEAVLFVVEKPGARWIRLLPIERESPTKATIPPLRFRDQSGPLAGSDWHGPLLPGNLARKYLAGQGRAGRSGLATWREKNRPSTDGRADELA